MARRRINFQRLNHALIPQSREAREQAEASWLLRALFGPLFLLLGPFTREGMTVIVLAVLATALAVDVQGTGGYLLVALLGAALACAWVSGFAWRVRDVELSLEHPQTVIAGEPLTVHLRLVNRGAVPLQALRTRWMMLSWDGTWLGERPVVAEVPAGGTVRLMRQACFSTRGQKHAGDVGVAVLAPGGLTLGPVRRAGAVNILVLPRPTRITGLVLPPQALRASAGARSAPLAGEAMELVGVRPYRSGDPVRRLHARTWARTGQPHVREYQPEVDARIGVFLDLHADRLGEFGLEAGVSLAAGMVAALLEQAPVDALILGHVSHRLGGGAVSLDRALTWLALAAPQPTFDVDATETDLLAAGALPATLVLILLDWEPSRAAFVQRLEARGVHCVVRVLHDGAPLAAAPKQIDIGPILAGEGVVA